MPARATRPLPNDRAVIMLRPRSNGRSTNGCGTSPEFPGYGLDAQCRDHNHCAGFAVQCRSFSRPFDGRRADTYAQTQEDELHCVSRSLKPLYPRHPLVPHGWATVNIAKRYRVAIRCMAVVKQRIMPRAANRYYASSWVIGSHLTDMLTSRRANVAALVLLQFARQSRLTRSKLKLETRAGRGSPVHENAS